jgi:hypothetical protein|tara:strand:- start:66 stop:719 length:654 start_codon:yes stop_codon:yes gene_type:complete
MDDKYKKDEIQFDKLIKENRLNSQIIDETVFDETLKEIDQILINLEKQTAVNQEQLENFNILPEIKTAISKINVAKNELVKEENKFIKNNNLLDRIEDLEKNIIHSNKPMLLSDDLKKETISEIKEHEIDKNILTLEELHTFEENNKNIKKNSFNFYSYLMITIVMFFVLYGALTISKDLIILKYPVTESYINYFYEIVEILKITIFGFFAFVKNII